MGLTNNMINEMYDALMDRIVEQLQYVGVGTDGTAPSSTDTALGNEILRKARQEYTRDDGNKQVTISLFLTSVEANGYTLREVGTFNASTGGVLFTRNTFPDLLKDNTMEVWIDIVIDIDLTEG